MMRAADPGLCIGDAVMICGGVSWLQHGIFTGMDIHSFTVPFCRVRLYGKDGYLTKRMTLVPRKHLCSFGPPLQPRPCRICSNALGYRCRMYCSPTCRRISRHKQR